MPAVLITAYYNSIGEPENIEGKLLEAEKRARSIPGGFCGFYGNCGAGVGTGMFISIITEASPLSKKEWKLCNLMTARSLMEIAENGGPRCCKRDTFIALSEAASFVRDNLGAELEENKNIKCEFNHMNRQCLGHECKYHHSNY